jgi:hypothetical protein
LATAFTRLQSRIDTCNQLPAGLLRVDALLCCASKPPAFPSPA